MFQLWIELRILNKKISTYPIYSQFCHNIICYCKFISWQCFLINQCASHPCSKDAIMRKIFDWVSRYYFSLGLFISCPVRKCLSLYAHMLREWNTSMPVESFCSYGQCFSAGGLCRRWGHIFFDIQLLSCHQSMKQ